jgi:hypothetical protein
MSSIDQHNFSIATDNRGTGEQPGCCGLNASTLEAQAGFVARLNEMIAEHDDLDLAVASLLSTGCSDDLVISRLKKRKLYLKDEIARAQGCLPGSAESAA